MLKVSEVRAGYGQTVILQDMSIHVGTGEIVTIIEGAQSTPSATAALRAWLADEHAGLQVEVHRGGQPLYPYLFGVE